MKRFWMVLSLALCLALCCASVALADITITEQPETQTVEAGGTVSFTVKAEGAADAAVTWHFVNPETGKDITGRKLADAFKGLKVSGPNKLKITLKKVPEEMHGLVVHCHIGKKNAGVDTDEVLLLIAGMEVPGSSAEAEGEEEPETETAPEQEDSRGDDSEDADYSDGIEEPEDPEDGEEPAEDGESESAEPESGEFEEVTENAKENTAVSVDSTASTGIYPEIRGYQEGADYQYLQLGTYYYDRNGGKAPLLWRILYREGDKLTLMTEYVIDVHQIYETDTYYGRTEKKKFKKHFNDPYEELGIYFWLNGEMAETIFSESDFSAAIIPHKVKETYKGKSDESEVPEYTEEELAYASGKAAWIDTGGEDQFPYGKDLFYIMTYGDMKKGRYGFPATYSGDAIENEGEVAIPEAGRRKTWPTPYAKNKVLYPQWEKKLYLAVMPEYNGTSPYWAIKRRKGYYMVGIVGGNGHLSWRAMDSVQIGVRPATRIDLNKLKLTGGNGTEDKPWKLEIGK